MEYIIKAKITEVDDRYGWCYKSCTYCKKEILGINTYLYCDKCNEESKSPQMRYEVEMKVSDGTVEATFILFDTVTQRLVGLSCSQLLNKQGNDQKNIPKALNELFGQMFVFKIQLRVMDLKEGYESYTMTKLFVIDEKLEDEYKLRELQKANNGEYGSQSSTSNMTECEILTPKIKDMSRKMVARVQGDDPKNSIDNSCTDMLDTSKERERGNKHKESDDENVNFK
ncbi:replication factor A protein 1-like [Pistacia vera]|uniref:replication factor A protein 1-like n=1 Tax=Pistacia vera TaxID=55513 RepID=UPI001262E763|nr:replication factor A protein 1-like [Pistacia vera]